MWLARKGGGGEGCRATESDLSLSTWVEPRSTERALAEGSNIVDAPVVFSTLLGLLTRSLLSGAMIQAFLTLVCDKISQGSEETWVGTMLPKAAWGSL